MDVHELLRQLAILRRRKEIKNDMKRSLLFSGTNPSSPKGARHKKFLTPDPVTHALGQITGRLSSYLE